VPVLLIVVLVLVFLNASRDIAPPNTADLVPQRVEVADDENAFTHFNAAFAAADVPEKDELFHEILDGTKSDPEYVADILARNAEALKLLDRGLACRVYQAPEVHTIDDPLDYIMNLRTLSRLLWLKAAHDREAGRWADATTDCRDLLRLGDLAERDAGCFVHYLVGLALLGQGLDASEKLAGSPDVPEEQLQRLAKALADVGPLDRGLVQSLKGEYQMSSNTVDDLAEGNIHFGEGELKDLPLARVGYVFQPNKTKQLFAEIFRDYLKNVPLPPAQRKFIDIEQWIGHRKNKVAFFLGSNSVGKILVALMCPATEAVLQAGSRRQGNLAATRLIVACRRYEIDHGSLPPTLDSLVPECLDAVPADPYDGKPMRYVRARAIVYSIGKDFADAGGSQRTASGQMPGDENYDRWEAEDAVFFIHGEPKTKPAEPPTEENNNESDDGR